MRLLNSFWLIFSMFLTTNILANKASINSLTAVGQTAHFAIKYSKPLRIDKATSLKLNEFIAYEDAADNSVKILLGPALGEGDLKQVCYKPQFLANEQIPFINHNKPVFFEKPFKGCEIALDAHKSLVVLQHPVPFTDQQGRKVKYVAIVADQKTIPNLLNNITFNLTAEQFYLNLL